jgi:hypothetical protein
LPAPQQGFLPVFHVKPQISAAKSSVSRHAVVEFGARFIKLSRE